MGFFLRDWLGLGVYMFLFVSLKFLFKFKVTFLCGYNYFSMWVQVQTIVNIEGNFGCI